MEAPTVKDWYRVLDITQNATEPEINRAYRLRTLQWHPDKHGGRALYVNELIDAQEARDLLISVFRRETYDMNYARVKAEWDHYEAKAGPRWPRAHRHAKGEPFANSGGRPRPQTSSSNARVQKERLAEERSRQAAVRAQELLERAAEERLRKQVEREAEQKARDKILNDIHQREVRSAEFAAILWEKHEKEARINNDTLHAQCQKIRDQAEMRCDELGRQVAHMNARHTEQIKIQICNEHKRMKEDLNKIEQEISLEQLDAEPPEDEQRTEYKASNSSVPFTAQPTQEDIDWQLAQQTELDRNLFQQSKTGRLPKPKAWKQKYHTKRCRFCKESTTMCYSYTFRRYEFHCCGKCYNQLCRRCFSFICSGSGMDGHGSSCPNTGREFVEGKGWIFLKADSWP